MAEVIFPDEWWNLSTEDYEEAKLTLRTLTRRELDPSTKDVRYFVFLENGGL